jgi:hypothetical protein
VAFKKPTINKFSLPFSAHDLLKVNLHQPSKKIASNNGVSKNLRWIWSTGTDMYEYGRYSNGSKNGIKES